MAEAAAGGASPSAGPAVDPPAGGSDVEERPEEPAPKKARVEALQPSLIPGEGEESEWDGRDEKNRNTNWTTAAANFDYFRMLFFI